MRVLPRVFVATMLTGAVGLGAAPAPAAPASATGASAAAPGAEHAVTGLNGWCDGDEVKTCVYVDIEGTSATAKASIVDVADGKNFSVDVTQIRLQRSWNGRFDTWGWKQLGWKDDRDWMWTSAHSCSTHRPALWRAVAWYRWKPNAHGGIEYDRMRTGWFGSPCQT